MPPKGRPFKSALGAFVPFAPYRPSEEHWGAMAKALGVEDFGQGFKFEITRAATAFLQEQAASSAQIKTTEAIDWVAAGVAASQELLCTLRGGGDMRSPAADLVRQSLVPRLQIWLSTHSSFERKQNVTIADSTAIIELLNLALSSLRVDLEKTESHTTKNINRTEYRDDLIIRLANEFETITGKKSTVRNDHNSYGIRSNFVLFLVAFWRSLPSEQVGRPTEGAINEWARTALGNERRLARKSEGIIEAP